MTIKAVILGATGYVGGELLRLLAGHPEIGLAAAVSTSQAGKPIASAFPHLAAAYPTEEFFPGDGWHETMNSSDRLAVFSAAPHGASASLVQRALEAADGRNLEAHVVDSSADFRYAAAAEFESVYGGKHLAPDLIEEFSCAVPEHVTDFERRHAAHPGCFATAMLLAAVPLYQSQLVKGNVFISGTTGSTGSGKSPQAGTHHPERHSNLYAYKPLGHRHVPEVENLIAKATGQTACVNFVPHSGPFARGIYITMQAPLAREATRDDVLNSLDEYYSNAEFVQVIDETPKLKNVVASNYAQIGADTSGDSVVVMCAIDNLIKGAAGGAIQIMNRLWLLPESSGLTSAAPAWT